MRLQRLALRSVTAALALLLSAAILGGCGSASSAPGSSGAVATFHNSFLVFGYPPVWKPAVFKITRALHFSPMVYLSSQPVHHPCHSQQSSTVCGWPLDRLRPGGTLIVWENRGYPGWSLRTTQGRSLQIGGRKAKQTVSRPGQCAAIGADETIAVAIARPIPDNWTSVTACLKGPGLANSERELDALLASTRFLSR